MRRQTRWMAMMAAVVMLLMGGCKGEQKAVHYGQLYGEAPAVVYVARLTDYSARHAIREVGDSAYNESLNVAAKHAYLSIFNPLLSRGYYVAGPLVSAKVAEQIGATGKQLKNGDISNLKTDYGIDAVLFVDIQEWSHTNNTWTVEAEYTLRSTHTGSELWHARVKATKKVHTDFKGRPKPLKDDIEFGKRYGCDVETAQRCRLVELMNEYVIADWPSGWRIRTPELEPKIKARPEYYNLMIHRDGSVEMKKSTE